MAILITKSDLLDFSPSNLSAKADVYAAPILIERAIIEGSGGPENVPITNAGLRFIRYLLALESIRQTTYLPNFKNMDAIRKLSKLFIHECGSAAQAMQTMYTIMHSIDGLNDQQ